MPLSRIAAAFVALAFALGVAVVSAADFTNSPNRAYLIKSWGAGKDKLPQSSVITMTQTRDGYLWLGTVNGLARFDGSRFEVFNQWNTPGLGDNVIIYLFEDSKGGLWVGTQSAGIKLIRNGRITDIAFPDSAAAQLMSVCEDTSGAVWLYTMDGRLGHARNDKVQVFPSYTAPNNNPYYGVIVEKSGQVWIAPDIALGRLLVGASQVSTQLVMEAFPMQGKRDYLLAARNGGYWQFVNGQVLKCITNQADPNWKPQPYPWEPTQIKSACEDLEGNLIVGTRDKGVYSFSADGRNHRIDELPSTALSLCLDREGNVWVGTDGNGLFLVKRKHFAVQQQWVGHVVQSVAEDGTGGLWVGFREAGIYHYKDGNIVKYGPALGLEGTGNNGLPFRSTPLIDRKGNLWVGTSDAGLFSFNTNSGRFQNILLPSPKANVIFENRSGVVWIPGDNQLACWNGIWNNFVLTGNQPIHDITALADDGQTNVWIGTQQDGLHRVANQRLTGFHVKDGLPCENITSLLADDDDVLWIGTGNGLVRMQGSKFTIYTKKEGLAGNGISYLLDDKAGNLWIGSNAGLMRVPKKSLTDFANGRADFVSCRAYGEADGLPTEECSQGSQPAACRARDGRLWFPTIRGLVSVDPTQLRSNTNPPPVVIESVLVDGREQFTNKFDVADVIGIKIPASSSRLDISFASLNLGAPEQARFKYRMEGHDEWAEVGNITIASYTKLQPKKYHFQVTACNEDGVWNPGMVSLEVLVLPAFWQTWWFRTLVVLGIVAWIGGTVYFVATQKLQRQLALFRQQEALEKERARIARDLHDQLGANLTQVALLGEMVEEDKNQPDEVEAHARQISETARETTTSLDEIVWAANPANDTLDSLATYACKYAQDYLALAGLRHRLEVPADLPETPLPPDLRHNVFLAFKESINNVVKHAKATEARIRLRLDANRFSIEIEDNGRGPGDALTKTGRNGLRNMRKRMEDVGGSFSIGPAAERGTIVRLTAPLIKK